MNDLEAALAALRPVRLPAGAGEPALLALLALAGALAGLALAALAVWLWRRRAAPRAEALAALGRSRDLPAPERLAAQARLARALARRLDPRASSGLAPLDRALKASFFAAQEGQALGEALYRRETPPAATLEAIDRTLAALIAGAPARRLAKIPSGAPR